ncbi:DUF4249 domain-containing protein [Pedobacter sp. BS3]|uniref:DUF4249 domain-containing protein n=1 Tax=Pedobacter sp. BS3 TaxID=2567937 RepID=UPI0016596F0A|nr:DUF4249 domain-containing protein [Pedobacter sp. BS3]
MKVRAVFGVIMLSILGISCQKVIDIKVNDAASQLVVEATVTNTGEAKTVKLSRSVPFNQTSQFPTVSGAVVTVTAGNGHTYPFIETEPGTYISNTFTGNPGSSYSLKIAVDNQVYQAVSVMPKQVGIDSLGVEELSFASNTRKSIFVYYHDPEEESNQYRFVVAINNRLVKELFTDDDKLTNGREVKKSLFFDDDDIKLKSGDKVQVEMQCIDKNVYTYFYSLSQQQPKGPTGSATPYNPPSNITNNALGYFSAYTVSRQTVTVK